MTRRRPVLPLNPRGRRHWPRFPLWHCLDCAELVRRADVRDHVADRGHVLVPAV